MLQDLLTYLETFIPGTSDPQLTPNVPSALTIASACPGHQMNNGLETVTQINCKSRFEISNMAISLINSTATAAPRLRDISGARNSPSTICRSELSNLIRYWCCVRPEEVYFYRKQTSKSTLIVLLETCRSLLPQIDTIDYPAANVVRFSIILAEVISACLKSFTLAFAASIEPVVRLLSSEIAASCRRSSLFRRLCLEHLQPRIEKARADASPNNDFSPDIQVSQ